MKNIESVEYKVENEGGKMHESNEEGVPEVQPHLEDARLVESKTDTEPI